MAALNMRWRRLHPGVLVLALCFWLAGTISSIALTTPAQAAGCPNEQAREQNNSTNLPDCRAYEMVSPLDKNGGDVNPIDDTNSGGVVQATPDGSKITFASITAFGAAQGGVFGEYLSVRGDSGWSTQNISLPQHSFTKTSLFGTPYKIFNPELTEALVLNSVSEEVAIEDPPLGGAPAGYRDYYLHNLATSSNRALVTTAPPEPPASFNIERNLDVTGDAATPDLAHVIVESAAELSPGVTLHNAARNLYEWTDGRLEPVNILPGVSNETQPGASLGGSGETELSRAISDNGSRVIWTGDGELLYVREGIGSSQAKTVQIDAGVGERDKFLTASTDGARVFFTTTTQNIGDLYEYDLETEAFTDLTPTTNPHEADVQRTLGASADGSYVYFVASGALAPGATSQNCEPGNVDAGCNLYLWRAGVGLTFIARLTGRDESALGAEDWSAGFERQTTRVSSDGHELVFMSQASLTGYNNSGPSCVPEFNEERRIVHYGSGNCEEVYEYDADGGRLMCLSCDASGAGPRGPSSIPPAAGYGNLSGATYQSRVLADNGNRVFFDSNDALASTDTNNKQDVYEWEASGTDACNLASGCVSQISGGASSEDSTFVDASQDGRDVFFTTRQELTPGDTDQQVDLYDAREDGGFTTVTPPACAGTGCQGLPANPPVFATPPTSTYNGVGNFALSTVAGAKPRPKTPTRAQQLAKALKRCRTERKRQRRLACEKQVRRRYRTGVKRSRSKTSSHDERTGR